MFVDLEDAQATVMLLADTFEAIVLNHSLKEDKIWVLGQSKTEFQKKTLAYLLDDKEPYLLKKNALIGQVKLFESRLIQWDLSKKDLKNRLNKITSNAKISEKKQDFMAYTEQVRLSGQVDALIQASREHIEQIQSLSEMHLTVKQDLPKP